MPETRDAVSPPLSRHEQMEMRLALQRLAAGYYNRPDVLLVVARRILLLEEKNRM